MTDDDFDRTLGALEARYPALFRVFRDAGWSERRTADPVALAREPYWGAEYPRHALATQFLRRFQGLRCHDARWKGVVFGCEDAGTATTLKQTRPYHVEELILLEGPPWSRPPAFPIGTMNDWMLFLRDDWTTITVGFNWRDALITRDPFEVINDFYAGTHRVWADPARHVEIHDLDRVPPLLIGGAYDS